MEISEFKLKRDFNAPKINLESGEMQSYKMFRAGNYVLGYVNETAGKPLVVVNDTHVIPIKALEFIKDITTPEGKSIATPTSQPTTTSSNTGTTGSNTNTDRSGNSNLSPEEKIKADAIAKVKSGNGEKIEIPKEYREQMEKIKNTNVVGNVVNKSRNSVNGMLIGAAIGLVISIITKQSKFGGIILGATAGGFVGYKMNSDEKKKTVTEVKTVTQSNTETPNTKK